MNYTEKRDRLVRDMREAAGNVRLSKDTTNLFRHRSETDGRTLNVRDFNNILAVNTQEQWVEVEGMTTYEKLVDECLKHGVMPAVVPELKSITIGGAVSGTGLESSSFKHGFVHETVLEMEILLPEGRVVTCTPDNEHRELFFGIPNSYGTFGYILRLKAKTIPVKKYVRVTHQTFSDPNEFFPTMKAQCADGKDDFVEGVVFSPVKHVMSTAVFVDSAPYVSDYTFMNIYYRSLLTRTEDYVSVRDYIWRWDTDWFWRSDVVFAQNPLVRLLLGKKRLNSIFYTRMMRLNRKWRITDKFAMFKRRQTETIIQDVEIPIDNAAKFLEFFHQEIKMTPIIIGPVIGGPTGAARFPLFPLDPKTLYVNIGFWGLTEARKNQEYGYLNKLIEAKVTELQGRKMLYSDSFFSEQTLSELYGGEAYKALKAKYDPQKKLKTLYQKCVLKG